MRYERKYKINPVELQMVHQTIRLHPASFTTIFPDRQVNNVYFDTPDLTTFKDNVIGISERKKFRVRWYGDDPATIESPRFEIKIKSNELGDKKVLPIEPFKLGEWPALCRAIAPLSQTNKILQPVLMNAYHRSYYGTSNGRFRITIDSDLRYHSLLTARNFTRFNYRDPEIILELKYDEEWEKESEAIRQFLPFRHTKSSKYVKGVELTCG